MKALNEERVTKVIVDGEVVGYTIAVTQEEMDIIADALCMGDDANYDELTRSLYDELELYVSA